MSILFLILAGIAFVGGLVCWIMILVDAFQDEIWKGIVGLIFPIYLAYYGIVEYEHDWKWAIVIGAIAGDAIAIGLYGMASR